MEKVLIISYFFPPGNLTAVNRSGSWAKYFHKFGIYPIIITREWEGHELSESGRLESCGEQVRHVNGDGHEVYYMPYRANLRDRIFLRSKTIRPLALLSKLLTFLHLILEKFLLAAIPYHNIYSQAKKVIQEEDIKCLIISANPFEQFLLGYRLKKKFKHLKYITDFRDDWTTNPLLHDTKKSLPARIIHKYNRIFEKRWISVADLIVAAAPAYGKRLNQLHNKPFKVIVNGYRNELENIKASYKKPVNPDTFVISYSGLIYDNQDFSLILDALKYHARNRPQMDFQLVLIGGLAYRTGNPIMQYSDDTIPNLSVKYTEFLDWEVNIDKLLSSDVLLMTAYGQIKGVLPSKTFEYMGTGKPVILYPSDKDIIEELLKKSGLGFTPRTAPEMIEVLERFIAGKSDGTTSPVAPNQEFINELSRQVQAEKMVQIIHELCAE